MKYDFSDFHYVSSIDVDSGIIWIGDPCYIIHTRSNYDDLGKDWSDFCYKFSYKSGYQEYSNISGSLNTINKKDVQDDSCSVEKEIKNTYTGVASFEFENNNNGLGTAICSSGDGRYPVYVQYTNDKRIKRILIELISDE